MGKEVWSCGGGTQSGAIAALIGDGRLPAPDMVVMVDTGRERSSTWSFVNGFIRPQLAKAGLDVVRVRKEKFATVDLYGANGDILMPGFTNQSGSVGKLSSYCSNEWKKRVTMRYLRSVGVEECRNWIGISVDEMHRVRTPDTKWLQLRYPLIYDIPMRRHECVSLIKETGWSGHIPHSSCWMCPNHTDAEWIEMKTGWPADFAAAITLERDVQQKDPHFFLHPSCVPLGEVDFFAQRSLFADRDCIGNCFT